MADPSPILKPMDSTAVASGTDRLLTEHQRTLDALRASEEFARNLIESSIDMIIAADRERKITEFNHAAESAFGYSRAEILGRDVGLLYAEAQQGTFIHKKTIKDGHCVAEVMNRRKNGEIFPSLLSSSVMRNAHGEEIGIMGISRDITERKHAEQTLLATERKLKLIAENTTEVIFAYDLDHRLIYVNPAVEKMTGYSVDDLMKGHFIRWMHPEDEPRIMELWDEAFRLGRYGSGEFRLLTRSNRTRWCHSSIGPMRGEDGHQVGVLVVNRDITVERELEEQFRQAQKMEAVGQLAGGVAHDFNNIIAIIRGYSDLILRKLPKGDPLRSKMESIRVASSKATEITRQLLAFSNKQMLQPRVIDLNAHLRSMHEMIQRLIGENIELTTHVGSAACVRVDPSYLDQVIMNLVVNARDSMPEGGRLTIRTELESLDPRKSSAQIELPAGVYVKLSVVDTGTGMAPEVCARVFEPFFTTKKPGKGSGLGLSTAYGIVKQSGGFIRVHSLVGRGTTFIIHLPRAEGKPEKISSSHDDYNDAPRGSETVLVVEDDEILRHVAVEILETLGYRVSAARDAEEALRLFSEGGKSFQLLFTDVVMPTLNGIELANRIGKLSPGTRVLYSSGYAEQVDRSRDVLDPSRNFLPKPYDTLSLGRMVRIVLDRR